MEAEIEGIDQVVKNKFAIKKQIREEKKKSLTVKLGGSLPQQLSLQPEPGTLLDLHIALTQPVYFLGNRVQSICPT